MKKSHGQGTLTKIMKKRPISDDFVLIRSPVIEKPFISDEN